MIASSGGCWRFNAFAIAGATVFFIGLKALVLYLKDKQTFSQLFSLPGMQPLKQAIIPKVGLN